MFTVFQISLDFTRSKDFIGFTFGSNWCVEEVIFGFPLQFT